MSKPSQELSSAMDALWRLPPRAPEGACASPSLTELREACGGANLGPFDIALSNALQALGAPYTLPETWEGAQTSAEDASVALANALQRTKTHRRYLCPLDLADTLPTMNFGAARIAYFTVDELRRLFDAERLARTHPGRMLDYNRLAQFQWLVVEEGNVAIDSRPGARALPILFEVWGELGPGVEPHASRLPVAVEDCLLFLLLAQWENWTDLNDYDWRGFRLPWVYTVDADLVVRAAPPPDVDQLTIAPRIFRDEEGEEVEVERPLTLPLDPACTDELKDFDQAAWIKYRAALEGPLFETPIRHFMVKAFMDAGMDEFMAHMTAIEAALGHVGDYRFELRTEPNPAPKLGATARLTRRIVGLLDDAEAGQIYGTLFDLRSAYVHGRGEIAPLAHVTRRSARRLARRVVFAAVQEASAGHASRDVFLNTLLARGVAHNDKASAAPSG